MHGIQQRPLLGFLNLPIIDSSTFDRYLTKAVWRLKAKIFEVENVTPLLIFLFS